MKISESEFFDVTFTKPYSGKVCYSYRKDSGEQVTLCARKLYDFFNVNPNEHFAKQCDQLTKGLPLHPGEIGWSMEKDIRKYEDITWVGLFWKTGPKVNIVRDEVKAAIEKAGLTGARFFPIWVREVQKSKKPDYWGLVTSNALDFRHTAQGGIEYQKDKFTIAIGVKDRLCDLSCLMLNPDGIKGNFVLPRIISKKAHEVFSQFRGVTFRRAEFV